MKQTAVEWLYKEMIKKSVNDPSHNVLYILQHAKEMEKEQMNDTWEDSRLFDKGDDYIGEQKSFEQYYNEIFNTK
jgi:hypothetical protein